MKQSDTNENQEEDRSHQSESSTEMSYDLKYTKEDVTNFIIFLFCKEGWMFAVVLGVCYTYCVHLFLYCFDIIDPRAPIQFLIYVVEVMFLVDCISLLLYFILNAPKKRYIRTRHKVLIIVDLITLPPLIIGNILKHYQLFLGSSVYLIFAVFRLYRITHYFYLQDSQAGTNAFATMMAKFAVFYFLIIHTGGCVWYVLAKSDVENKWTIVESPLLIPNSTMQWYLTALYYTSSIVTGVGFGDLYPVNTNEQSVTCAMVLIGYTLIIGLFVGAWTTVQTSKFRQHAIFNTKMKLILEDLNDPKIDNQLRDQIIDYYLVFWERKRATKKLNLLEVFPKSLTSEIFLDQYWGALINSHLFFDLSDAFCRGLASVMETQILQPGDIIFVKGKIRDIMLYIVSGNVQILSAVDNESPIMNFSSGTVLNEFGLLFSTISPVTVQASTFCELQILRKVNLWRVTSIFKDKSRMFKRFKKKISLAKKMEQRKLAKSNKNTMQSLNRFKNQLFERLKLLESQEFHSHFVEAMLSTKKTYVYVASKISQNTSDDICLRTTWPWILQPQSIFHRFWEQLICVCVVCCSILIPYYATFVRKLEPNASIFFTLIDTIFIIDIIILISTAVEEKYQFITTIKDILMIRCRTLSFTLDMLTIFPTSRVILISYENVNERLEVILMYNRLLKCYRVLRYFVQLENRFQLNFAIIRCIKYIMIFMFITYWCGCVYYSLACFYEECNPDSWIGCMQQNNISLILYPLQLSLNSAMSIVSQTGFGTTAAKNFNEALMLQFYFLVGVILFSYLVSDYSAVLALNDLAKTSYQGIIDVIYNTFTVYSIPLDLQKRVKEFLSLQWTNQQGYLMINDDDLMADAPQHHLKELRKIRYNSMLKSMEIFQELDDEIINKIALECKFSFIPPNEIILYAGQVISDCYVIAEGYCEIISAATGTVEKIAGPKTSIGVLEMLIETGIVHNIRTVTHVKMYGINFNIIKQILHTYEDSSVYESLMSELALLKKSMLVQQWKARSTEIITHNNMEIKKKSWFRYQRTKESLRDYREPFANAGVFKYLRFVLLPVTIIPDGMFIVVWETIRAVVAILSGLLYPSYTLLCAAFPWLQYVVIFLDCFCVIDIYLRFHMGYYNEKGCLVSHPLYTANYYLSHSFCIDLFSTLSLDVFISSLSTERGKTRSISVLEELLRMNHVLQMYRVPPVFQYWSKDIFTTHISLLVLKYFFISLVFFCVLTQIAIIEAVQLMMDGDQLIIKLLPDHWVAVYSKNVHYDLTEPFYLWFTGFYWIVNMTMTNGFGDITAKSGSMMIVVTIFIVLGYLWFTYMLVILAMAQTNAGFKLTIFQIQLKSFLNHMDKDRVEAKYKKEIIQYFEFVWQRGRTLSPEIINKCNVTLRDDFFLYLYKPTFEKVPIFKNVSETFLRRLSHFLKESYVPPNHYLIKCNNIVDKLYIVYSGQVEVYGPDGNRIGILEEGSLFGNLDNVSCIRSMVAIKSSTHLECLSITTLQFYEESSDIPTIRLALQKYFLLVNMSYVPSESKGILVVDLKYKSKRKARFLINKESFLYSGLFALYIFVAYVRWMMCGYQLAFGDVSFKAIIVICICDSIMILRIITSFITTYVDEQKGYLVTDLKKIRHRYLSTYTLFPMHLFSSLPLELLLFVFKSKWDLLPFFRINRLIDMVYITASFNKKLDNLHANIIIVKVCSIIMYLTMTIHALACFWWVIGCPNNVCNEYGWNSPSKTPSLCENDFICSTYFVFLTITSSGLGDIVPTRLEEMALVVVIMLLSQFVLAYFISEISAVVLNYTTTLNDYDDDLQLLKQYMRYNRISGHLTSQVLNYGSLLWLCGNGRQTPIMMDLIPYTLLEDIKVSAYGKHLFENYVFTSCHIDFLRQLIYKFKRVAHFPDNIIIQRGEINSTMYFIHQGDVEVLHKNASGEEVVLDTLHEMDCFSLKQGLFELTPQQYSFRSTSQTIILSLTFKDINQLFVFFPASKTEIYKRMEQINLD